MRQNIINKLIELRDDALRTPNTEEAILELMKKHEMLILGERTNTVYSNELLYRLGLQEDDYLNLIPEICKYLNMEFEEYILVEDSHSENPRISMYGIKLFK